MRSRSGAPDPSSIRGFGKERVSKIQRRGWRCLRLRDDNDIIPDEIEGYVDSDSDGVKNWFDKDGDGIDGSEDAGSDPNNPVDTDEDIAPDYLDSDDDDIPDEVIAD